MSASPLNYFVGKGILSFRPYGTTVPRDLGNAPAFSLTPQIEKLDHFSSRGGVREKDASKVTQKSGQAQVTLDEITLENIAMVLLGSISGSVMTLMAESEVKGYLSFTGTNDIGNRFNVDDVLVSFTPNQGLDFISEDYGQIQLTGEWLKDPDNATYPWGKITQIVEEE